LQGVIKTADGITDEWLGSVLGAGGLELLGVEAIGTGQMSTCYRVSYRRPRGERESVVVKLAATDQNSRDVGVNLGAYLREITFYRELRDRIDGGGSLAKCHLAVKDPKEGWFTLVLEDIEGGVQGDQIAGCGHAEARIAMVALARIHAPVFGDLALAATDWLNQPTPLNRALLTVLLPGFLERYRDRIAPEHVEVCERFVASADAWDADRRPPLGLVHGDYRLDNMLFHNGPARSLTGRRWASARR
jgi:Phosphotransferase enzyme family